MSFLAWGASEKNGPLRSMRYEPAPLGAQDVEIAITHCGICHSDLHLLADAWGIGGYPLVPGHEIIGQVAAVGSEVRGVQVGARVGTGWQRGSCLRCGLCLEGKENLCPEQQATCIGHFGGLADRIRTDARFVFAIPDAIASDAGAPLLCGGATVYAALRRAGAGPRSRVAVLGIGGLGHLALQFARTFGCHVTAVTSSPDKDPAARQLGAHDVVFARDAGAWAALGGQFDLILSTVHKDLEWLVIVGALRPGGTLCLLGAPLHPLVVPAGALLAGQKAITGSIGAGRALLRDMLEHAARTGVRAKVDLLPMSEANQGVERLKANQARFRVVLTNA